MRPPVRRGDDRLHDLWTVGACSVTTSYRSGGRWPETLERPVGEQPDVL